MYHKPQFRQTGKLAVLGPVEQSIVSLSTSLVKDMVRRKALTKSVVVIFNAEKLWGAFALQNLFTFMWQKNDSFYV